MLDRPTDQAAQRPSETHERAMAEARATRVLERAKAPSVAPFARPARAAQIGPTTTPSTGGAGPAARATQGISPGALAQTWADWLMPRPGARQTGRTDPARRHVRLAARPLGAPAFADGRHAPPFQPAPDRPAASPILAGRNGRSTPIVQTFLGVEEWWAEATREVPGLARDREAEVAFMALAFVDVVSPSNTLWLNPVSSPRPCGRAG